MNFKEIKRRLLTKERNGSAGCLMMLGMTLGIFGAMLVIFPLVKMLFCAVLSLRCIDEETGSKVGITWLHFIPLGLGILLVFIEVAYGRLKNNI